MDGGEGGGMRTRAVERGSVEGAARRALRQVPARQHPRHRTLSRLDDRNRASERPRKDEGSALRAGESQELRRTARRRPGDLAGAGCAADAGTATAADGARAAAT